jgi:hypothetical protein
MAAVPEPTRYLYSASESGSTAAEPAWLLRATSGLMQCSKKLLDHLVGAGEYCRGDVNAGLLSSCEIDDQLEPCGLLHAA